MDRRDFFKRTGLTLAAGALLGPRVLADEAEKRVVQEELSGKILNYNPRMQYRPMGRTGVDVSALGFGMLRLPMQANGSVDFDQSVAMVRRAIEGGVNYIDTGRVYLNGQSEQLSERHSREDGVTVSMSPPNLRGGPWNGRRILRSSLMSRAVPSERMSLTSTTST